MASLHTRGASASANVEPFPVRPRQFSHEEIEGLASALLDLCSAYEAALRTAISMQRHLERIRRCREVSPEASLLVDEISRQLKGLTEGSSGLSERLRAAADRLDCIRCTD